MDNDTSNENPAIGRDALEYIDSLLTLEEIAESDCMVALMMKSIKEKQ